MFLAGLVLAVPALAQAGPFDDTLSRRGFEPVSSSGPVSVCRAASSRGHRFAAVGVIGGTPDQVQDLLLDYEDRILRVGRVRESRVLRREGSSMLVYRRLGLPVVSDRDYVLRVRWGTDGEARWIRTQAVTNRGPGPRDGIVRITECEGRWRLLPARGGRATLAYYETLVDLGGSVPRWAAQSRSPGEIRQLFALLSSLF